MDRQAQARSIVGNEQTANSDDCDLNQLARQTLGSVPANLLPLEPFPSGFDLEALAASSRSSHPPPAAEPDPEAAAEARLDLRSMVPPTAVGQRSSVPPRRLPARKRSAVVDLAPPPVARPQPSEPDLDALTAARAFAASSVWAEHIARVAAAAQQAPRWSWAAGGALLVALAWLISGSRQAPAAAPIVPAAIATSPAATDPSPRAAIAAIQFSHTALAAQPRIDSRVAYNRARPARSSAAATTPEPPSVRMQAPAPEPPSTQERTMDTLLDQALRNEGAQDPVASAPRAKAGSGLPKVPLRAAVADALGGLGSRVRFCAGGRSGVATAHVVVRKDGHVASVRISGAPFSSTASGSCMESVLRGARFPAFEQPTFSVTYPFQL